VPLLSYVYHIITFLLFFTINHKIQMNFVKEHAIHQILIPYF
jgi:uncharacterized membrane protein